MGLADAYRAEGNEDRALMELRAARSTFERVGASIHAELAREATATTTTRATTRTTRLARPSATSSACDGDHWTITYDGKTVTVRDLRGLGTSAGYSDSPDASSTSSTWPATAPSIRRTTHSEQDGLSAPGDAGPLLDEQAKDMYKRRLADIDDDLREAGGVRGHRTAARAKSEREFLVRELSRAVGLGGRDRQPASASERARAAVTQAVRHAMARITEHHPELGEHLNRTVRTGTYCVYLRTRASLPPGRPAAPSRFARRRM